MASPEAVRLFTQIYAKVDAQVRDIVNSMLPNVSVAAQDDGSVIANDHRILNFQGDGVTVSNDPALRRVDVFVPGSPTSSSTTAMVSTAGNGKALQQASSATTPPTGWYTSGFNDSAWTTVVLETGSPPLTLPTGSVLVTERTGFVAFDVCFLHRRSFTLPAGTPSAASLEFLCDDDLLDVYINGTRVGQALGGGSPAQGTMTISPSLLVVGTNLLAVRVRNVNPGTTGPYGIAYRLAVGMGSAGTDSRYQLLTEKNQANGYAGLDSGTRVPTARLGSGTADSTTFLRGDQTWAAGGGGGMSNPMTTQDDIIVGGSSGTPGRLAKGTDGQVLTIDSSSHHVAWATPSGGGTVYQAAARRNATLALGSGALALLQWDTLLWDNDSVFQVGGAHPNRITPTHTGWWMIQHQFYGSSINWMQYMVANSDSATLIDSVTQEYQAYLQGGSGLWFHFFSTGDFISLGMYNGSGSSGSLQSRVLCTFLHT